MKRIFGLSAVLVVLIGCAEQLQTRAVPAISQERIAAYCVTQGYGRGSTAFEQCVTEVGESDVLRRALVSVSDDRENKQTCG